MKMIQVGDIVRTPFDPSGLVEVIEIEPPNWLGKRTVRVRYIEDHPHGYKAGTLGRYYLDELQQANQANSK